MLNEYSPGLLSQGVWVWVPSGVSAVRRVVHWTGAGPITQGPMDWMNPMSSAKVHAFVFSAPKTKKANHALLLIHGQDVSCEQWGTSMTFIILSNFFYYK